MEQKLESPLKPFANLIETITNPLDNFTCYGNTFKEGDRVSGTWVDRDGRTYHSEGIIIKHPATGLWVEQGNGGITEVKRFWTMLHKG